MGAGNSNAKAPKEQVAEIKKDKAKQDPKAAYVASVASRKNIIRVMGTDLDGDSELAHAFTGIKGIGHNFARAIIHVSGLDKKMQLKDMNEEKLNQVEQIIKDPTKFGIPSWMVNRQKDYANGQNIHFTGSDLSFVVREDINRLKKIRAYRGIRHELGQPTRGQRTKGSFRTGSTIGVQKRKDAKKGN